MLVAGRFVVVTKKPCQRQPERALEVSARSGCVRFPVVTVVGNDCFLAFDFHDDALKHLAETQIFQPPDQAAA